MVDLVLADARVAGRKGPVDIAIAGGKIVAVDPAITADAPRFVVDGKLITPGLVECHIHLDKAGILDRCEIVEGTLEEAVRETSRLKALFTEEDVYQRAAAVVEAAIGHGTMAMRSFVEVDPRAGLRSFDALKAIKADYAHAIDIEICAFAQEGLTNEPETEALLIEALANGADLVGGCTYTDADPAAHVAKIFDLAERFGTAVDFHVDFDLNPDRSDLPAIIDETVRRGWQGRVACGHVTKLAAWEPSAVDAIAQRLMKAGIGLVALPATDLFLLGRDTEMLTPRGVAPLTRLAKAGVVTAIGSNNILNPFTPYGDANLLRLANLFANVARLASAHELGYAFDLIGSQPAQLLGRSHDLVVGAPADLIMIDATSPAAAVRTAAPVLAGWKRGLKTFERPMARLVR